MSQFITPTNLVLLLVALYIGYIRLFPKQAAPRSIVEDDSIVFQDYDRKKLSQYNGVGGNKILMGIKGNVYDVSAGASFYGPDGDNIEGKVY